VPVESPKKALTPQGWGEKGGKLPEGTHPELTEKKSEDNKCLEKDKVGL